MATSPSDSCVSRRDHRWVAEWHPHEATWIAWPHNLETWPGRFDRIPPVFEQKIRILSEVEDVHVLGGPPGSFELASERLHDCQRAIVHRISTSDVWIRDYGPTFVLADEGRSLIGVDWRFNAWGNKYEGYDDDRVAAIRICNALGCKRSVSRLTCEGGGLETDGEGTLLATSSSLVTASRNPGWSREAIEHELISQLGVDKVVWVDGGGLEGDDTDSHIDQLVRFVRPGVVVVALASAEDDPDAAGLRQQRRRLMEQRDAKDRTFYIVDLPTPPPRYIDGKPVPESYCNFYIANELVLVPQFGYRATDDQAIGILRELFPERQMVPLDASDLIWGFGAFHCATQQQPRVMGVPPSDAEPLPIA